MARSQLYFSIIYCAIVLLITTASTDVQNPPVQANPKLISRKLPQHRNASSNASASGNQAPRKLLGSFELSPPGSHPPSDEEYGSFDTHSSPPASSFKSFTNPQLMAETDEDHFNTAEVEGRSDLRLSTRPTLSRDDIMVLGDMFGPFKGPRRRRRSRRSPAVNRSRQKIHFVYPNQGTAGVSNQNVVQTNSDGSKNWRPTLRNIENHRTGPLNATVSRYPLPRQPLANPQATPQNPIYYPRTANTTEFRPSPTYTPDITVNFAPSPVMQNSFQQDMQPASSLTMMPRVGTDPVAVDVEIWNRNGQPYDQQEIQAMLQKAMMSAWAQYGPGSKPPTYYQYNPVQTSKRQSPILLTPNFQPVTSEWDKEMTETPNRHEVLQPGLFNRILSTYIDFEVNNHETADLMRKIVVGFGVGLLIVGWVLLGLWIGFLPYKLLLLTKRDVEGKDYDEHSDSNHATSRNSIIRDITENVYLALDGDWLKKLEETVSKNSDSRWLKTNVHCCILPDAKTKGMAECQVIRKGRKDSAFKCISDLIYNFQFGPSDQPTSQ